MKYALSLFRFGVGMWLWIEWLVVLTALNTADLMKLNM